MIKMKRFKKFLRPVKHHVESVGRTVHGTRTAMEVSAGLQPLKPILPKVKKASEIKKVLFVAMEYDYGIKERGLSFEYNNLLGPLKKVADVVTFDFMSVYKEKGKKAMNDQLLREVKKEDPDLAFFFLYTDEFIPSIVKEISGNSRTITFNWFADDHWRFNSFSRYWAPRFNFCSTTDPEAFSKYRTLGYPNIIQTQWGANDNIYRNLGLKKDIDVSFVGQAYRNRPAIVRELEDKGITVECFGGGWPNGRVSQEEMVRIFSRSKINLNFSESSVGKSMQIKGRTFEVPSCGSFLLTEYAPFMENYYEIGKEIDVFRSVEELATKIQYYLLHSKKREKMANEAYQRTVNEHTYQSRFREIFSKIESATVRKAYA